MRGGTPQAKGPYHLGQIPNDVLREIGKQLIHRVAVGQSDISGDDFGEIFAAAVDGEHRNSPLGLADVLWKKCGWSAKTVNASKPFTQNRVRLISGRNSPDYSLGIENPHEDANATGQGVLTVWNARLDSAKTVCDELRVVVLVRNVEARQFAIFEEEPVRFSLGDFNWTFNKNGNLEGKEISSGLHRFTWQPHGSQFTIIRDVPGSVRHFSIPKSVPSIAPDAVLRAIKFSPDWVTIHT